ncbi:hypothetical protein BA768_03780 [Chryseobacterium sp. CBo1]|uniref:TonB-dependent receptor plug domain-containing protein n=1 Tax=Chryseobacterium sp. CBo1 TaxID=1869230 RepID=UPI0008106C2D|nr:TonB-dependent receptor plug domain-containing protein [Chryseobacterium sp. CBo1]OCK50916.1 hypothetical protein BA768_03780 [Chryseobacterium sp. CBo1]
MKITIPNPCHENWETMTPQEKGRFCSVCSKTVRDFTIAPDNEIIHVFSNSTEEICGKFNESQLNRNMQYSSINSVFVKFAVGFILTTGGLVSVQAQNITNDTLKVEEIGDVVIFPDTYQNKKKFVGSVTIIPQESLIKAQKIDSKVDPSILRGLNINPPKDSLNKKQIRIGGAQTTLRNEEKPLIVLDGKIIDFNDLQKTDPYSIKDIHILKDHSATALYGQKALNGVIVVTTKKKFKKKK